MDMQSLWKDDRKRVSKTKTSKFVGWCAGDGCGFMRNKADKGVCPKCGCERVTDIAPEMKEIAKGEMPR